MNEIIEKLRQRLRDLTKMVHESDASEYDKKKMQETLGSLSFLVGQTAGTAQRYLDILKAHNIDVTI